MSLTTLTQRYDEHCDLKFKQEELLNRRQQLTQRQLVIREANQQHQKETLAKLGKSLIESAQSELNQSYHIALVKTLGKMIHEEVKKAVPANLAGKKAMELAERSLTKFEGTGLANLLEFSENQKCMRLTAPVAKVILDIFNGLSCSEPNLTMFKNEIDKEALETILSCRSINKVIFSTSAQESTAVGVAREVARRRTLEIAFA